MCFEAKYFINYHSLAPISCDLKYEQADENLHHLAAKWSPQYNLVKLEFKTKWVFPLRLSLFVYEIHAAKYFYLFLFLNHFTFKLENKLNQSHHHQTSFRHFVHHLSPFICLQISHSLKQNKTLWSKIMWNIRLCYDLDQKKSGPLSHFSCLKSISIYLDRREHSARLPSLIFLSFACNM